MTGCCPWGSVTGIRNLWESQLPASIGSGLSIWRTLRTGCFGSPVRLTGLQVGLSRHSPREHLEIPGGILVPVAREAVGHVAVHALVRGAAAGALVPGMRTNWPMPASWTVRSKSRLCPMPECLAFPPSQCRQAWWPCGGRCGGVRPWRTARVTGSTMICRPRSTPPAPAFHRSTSTLSAMATGGSVHHFFNYRRLWD